MTLIPNWQRVLKHAWSLRFLAFALIFSALEVALPLLGDTLPVSQGVFAVLSGLATGLAFVSRLVAQNTLKNLGASDADQ